ncbi:MAG: hypothetical protein KJ709_05025 [Nanoarchaeota archaeon]|nr:hypothetical protein [Nanoarchaeota archaeon]
MEFALYFLGQGIEVRKAGPDGLTDKERETIDARVRGLGYDDVHHMATAIGFANAKDMAHNHNFKNPGDYFLGEGWDESLSWYPADKFLDR